MLTVNVIPVPQPGTRQYYGTTPDVLAYDCPVRSATNEPQLNADDNLHGVDSLDDYPHFG